MNTAAPAGYKLIDVASIFAGSDGEATKALYASLAEHGAAGEVALNLFRAQKSSGRAKVYRGGIRGKGSFRSMAYDRKQWAMSNLVQILAQHAADMQLTWGWKQDGLAPGFEWVLYVDVPTGQVSFHSRSRGAGPDYPGEWDRILHASPGRIISWCLKLLNGSQI